jgi:hypothetical protein
MRHEVAGGGVRIETERLQPTAQTSARKCRWQQLDIVALDCAAAFAIFVVAATSASNPRSRAALSSAADRRRDHLSHIVHTRKRLPQCQTLRRGRKDLRNVVLVELADAGRKSSIAVNPAAPVAAISAIRASVTPPIARTGIADHSTARLKPSSPARASPGAFDLVP